MKLSSASIIALSWLPSLAQCVFVRELDGTEQRQGNIIFYNDGTRGGGFRNAFACPEPEKFAYNKEKTVVGCCADSQHISGSKATGYLCCAEGHDQAGSEATGYTCCPTGRTFDGKVCQESRKPLCPNGKVLVDGECACPQGTTERADGTCAKKDQRCNSGIREGKCYLFKMDNGKYLGHQGDYAANDISKTHVLSKFKFCLSEKCDGSEAIDPGTGFRMQDMHSDAYSAQNKNQWVGNEKNGVHIRKTPHYKNAGVFTISKWSCGKYCLSGLDQGLGWTCLALDPSISFDDKNREMCRPVDVEEVPCDIRDPSNNCMWDKTEGSCSVN